MWRGLIFVLVGRLYLWVKKLKLVINVILIYERVLCYLHYNFIYTYNWVHTNSFNPLKVVYKINFKVHKLKVVLYIKRGGKELVHLQMKFYFSTHWPKEALDIRSKKSKSSHFGAKVQKNITLNSLKEQVLR